MGGSKKSGWGFKDNQKNNEDSSFYLYKTLEIQKYLNRFFKLYKVKIHNCKIFHTNNSLQIFISFYTSHKVINIFKKRLTKNAEKLKNCYKRLHLNTKNKKIDWNKVQKTKKIKKIKNFYLTPNPIEFQEILLNSLAVYTNNKLDIFIKLQNLNFSNIVGPKFQQLKANADGIVNDAQRKFKEQDAQINELMTAATAKFEEADEKYKDVNDKVEFTFRAADARFRELTEELKKADGAPSNYKKTELPPDR